MSKKIFTLLGGVLLLFGMTFTANAQAGVQTPNTNSLWNLQSLSLGAPVSKLTLGGNGYYHLKVDSISAIGSGGTAIGTGSGLCDSLVLYLTQPNADGVSWLFIDTLGKAKNHKGDYFGLDANGDPIVNDLIPTLTKAEESANSLWCTTVISYDGKTNVEYGFTNKGYNIPLEIDIEDYYDWDITDSMNVYTDTVKVPGLASGWKFSDNFGTVAQKQPIYTFVNDQRDSVAVLCIDTITRSVIGATSNVALGNVIVKIVNVDDLWDGKIDGVLYFTLTEANPFVLDANDFNTALGTSKDATGAPDYKAQTLMFDPAGNPTSLLEKPLYAEFIDWADTGIRIVPAGYGDRLGGGTITSPGTNTYPYGFQAAATNPGVDTTKLPGSFLDSLGYIYLRTTDYNGKYLKVNINNYYSNNQGGTQFLDFEATDDKIAGWSDSVHYGQMAWRLVYYPSGDSIYINPYQATYYPSAKNEILNKYNIPATGGWDDTTVLAIFSYYADTITLDLSTVTASSTTLPDYYLQLALARLKPGMRTGAGIEFDYLYYHQLYVTGQDLVGDENIITLGNGGFANSHAVDEQIRLAKYESCDGTGPSWNEDYTSVETGAYLIKNEKGEYLYVPLYSSQDSADWILITPESDVHPEYLPSFQWIIDQKKEGDDKSVVTITNREFPGLTFKNVQLYKDAPAPLKKVNFKWNSRDIDQRQGYGFIKLTDESVEDPYLGYSFIDDEDALVNLFSLQYLNKVDKDNSNAHYLVWSGNPSSPQKTDYIKATGESGYEQIYFRLDATTAGALSKVTDYGYTVEGTDLEGKVAQLKRQAYALRYEDPYHFKCPSPIELTNAEYDRYTLGSINEYPALGRPVFYLRHVYHLNNDYEQPSFALVQLIDVESLKGAYASDKAAFLAYVKGLYGDKIAEEVEEQILNATVKADKSSFNPGIFTLNIEESSGLLKRTLRTEFTNVATYIKEMESNPIYRRFNTLLEGSTATDDPDTLQFYTVANMNKYLYENQGMEGAANKEKTEGIDNNDYWNYNGETLTDLNVVKHNYLGLKSIAQFGDDNTAIYVDTAYVNRPAVAGDKNVTPKPQYLLAVDPQLIGEGEVTCKGTDTTKVKPYLKARYLINAYDSAHKANAAGVIKDDYDYMWNTQWERLVFVEGIHANDYLYIISDTTDLTPYMLTALSGAKVLDIDKVAASNTVGIQKLPLGNNLHKPYVWQFRLIEKDSKEFLIESETTENPPTGKSIAYRRDPLLRPCDGGWIKIQNGVPVISRSDIVTAIADAEVFDVYKTTQAPTAIEEKVVATKVTVVGAENAITILKAAGKKVTVSSIIGQTIASKVLASDSETISAPKGILVVAIEGEPAVKVLVK